MFKAGLVGTTGYTGMELARILTSHPQIKLAMVTARQEQGMKLEELYPFLRQLEAGSLILEDINPKRLAEVCDVVFLAIPHGVAMNQAAQILDEAKALGKEVKVVDLSADFRIKDVDVFESWYKVSHSQKEYLASAVYGLVDIYAEDIAKASLVANPGCYPTASILGLSSALKHDIIQKEGIIIDAKSGTTGAGRKAQVASLFCEVHDSFRPYGIGGVHRHTPEIEQEVSNIAQSEIALSFNPHLLPLQRGILTTIYTQLKGDYSQGEIQALYEKDFADAPFVRILPAGQLPETRNVRGSMFCDIALSVDKRTKRLIITAAIDNLCRGASGQAIANANIMLGLDVTTGLNTAPCTP